MNQFPQEFWINVHGLRPGMFVTRLDRPWLGTNYPLEGFQIGTEDEARELQSLCNFVAVDGTRGVSPDLRYVELRPTDVVRHARGEDEILELRKTQWQLRTDFDTELPQAEKAGKKPLSEFHPLDLSEVRTGVDGETLSIKRGLPEGAYGIDPAELFLN